MAAPNLPLPARGITGRERDLLWRMSQGWTYYRISREWGLAHQTVKALGAAVIRKMGAANITQAVAVALLEGVIGRWPECGSHATYQRHRKLRHTADPACLMGKAEHDRTYRSEHQE